MGKKIGKSNINNKRVYNNHRFLAAPALGLLNS